MTPTEQSGVRRWVLIGMPNGDIPLIGGEECPSEDEVVTVIALPDLIAVLREHLDEPPPSVWHEAMHKGYEAAQTKLRRVLREHGIDLEETP